ncbi:hypothetical protein D3C81_1229240 [compost metagenome]
MRLELGIDLCQENLKFSGNLVTALGSGHCGAGLGRYVEQGQRLRQANAGHARCLDTWMIAQLGFDRYGRDVLALGGLEQLLDPPGDTQAPLLIQFATVTGTEQAVGGVALGSQVRLFVIAQHLRRAFHQNFVVVADTAFDTRNRRTHVADAHLARQAEVRGAEVLRHAIAFKQFKAQLAVPLHHLDRQRRRTGQAGMYLVKPQGRENLQLHQLAFYRIGEDGGLFSGVDSFVDALIELAPQPRHGQEDRWTRATQVVTEGFQPQVEEHPAAAIQRHRFHDSPFGGVGQRQVGK